MGTICGLGHPDNSLSLKKSSAASASHLAGRGSITSYWKMIKNGITIENINEYTGLPIDEIAMLKKKVENEEL